MRLFPLLLLAVPALTAADAPPPADTAPAVLVPTIVARFPHDREAFTEGLIWHRGYLYESVGLEGQSDVRRVDLATGRVMARGTIPPGVFGEGLAAWKGGLVSLTWHGGTAYRWNTATLKRTGTAHYRGEGWGLTTLGDSLVRSDGSATLTVHDPASFAVRRRIAVTLNGKPVDQLNELEAVDGAILANIWRAPFIVRIDPASGRVTAIIDLRAIVAEIGISDDIEAVANGIAWDAAKRRLFVTGKRWPTMFEISLPKG
ncbi:glutaminyl-peptide cyclotransferase [Sphingomonas sp. CL5.1]|uniref:glutaminyl-peptide cyclotransferase n=1 Tax=Sphingomonas sp. CL5.1 TaxID=2653203 RepID=UPI001584434E|nr:glutaminyl-peptide cyclotransferase [Sphingomonas sp. CL5.1]QKR99054.1 glutaminyl-peptide cyclotransferase [Sphingomonas sp. CL5.1]